MTTRTLVIGLQLLAISCAATFAGAALYISVVEHPARLSLDTASAVAQWAPSYKRATISVIATVLMLIALGEQY